jgi:hypothetical protein
MSYYAVLIGVTKGPDSIMPRAVQTAGAMKTFLKSANVPEENVCLLDEPDRDRVDRALTWLTSVATSDDTLLLMYIGHGIQGSGKIPYGWLLTGQRNIDADDLAKWLDTVPSAARRIVISDCCYGEGIAAVPTGVSLFSVLCARLRDALMWLRHRVLTDFDAISNAFARQVVGKTHTVGIQAPMICISGAAADRQTDDGRERLLALLTIGAAAAGSTYTDLQGDFDRVKDGNKGFNVLPTPKDRWSEKVLATQGVPAVAPTLAIAAASASKA